MLISFFGHAQGLSIACSTPEAVCWDPSWANTHEISGRVMKNVHDSAEGFQYERRQDMKEKRSADDFVGETHLLCSREHGTVTASSASYIFCLLGESTDQQTVPDKPM